jgi:hypothetical protein
VAASILRDASGYRGWRLSASDLTAVVVALVGMVLIGRHSNRTGGAGHVAACALTGAVRLVMAAGFHDIVPDRLNRTVAARSAVGAGRVLGIRRSSSAAAQRRASRS